MNISGIFFLSFSGINISNQFLPSTSSFEKPVNSSAHLLNVVILAFSSNVTTMEFAVSIRFSAKSLASFNSSSAFFCFVISVTTPRIALAPSKSINFEFIIANIFSPFFVISSYSPCSTSSPESCFPKLCTNKF